MWLLSFLPDSFLLWIINIILLAGLVGTLSSFFIKFIPPLMPYASGIKIIGIVLLVVGVWFRGGYDVEMEWRKRVADLEAKIAIAEEKSKDTNTKIQTKIVEKVKVVKENTVVYRDRIKEVEKLIDKDCKVAPEAIDIHNAAAKNAKLGDNK
jgi:hypothetical protein